MFFITGNIDYLPVDEVLVFNNSVSKYTKTVSLISDTLIENTENFALILTTEDNSVTVGSNATVVIHGIQYIVCKFLTFFL